MERVRAGVYRVLASSWGLVLLAATIFLTLLLLQVFGGQAMPVKEPSPSALPAPPYPLFERSVQVLIAGICFSLWGVSAYLRCLDRRARQYLRYAVVLVTLWMLVVILKWNCFNVGVSTMLWYLYYVPMTLLPPIFLGLGARAAGLDRRPTAPRWERALRYASAALIVFVLTNSLHQQVFAFERATPGVVGEYEYRWGYWAVVTWSAACYGGFFACLAWASRKRLRLLIIPVLIDFMVGLGVALGYAWGVPWVERLNFSLIYAALAVVALECLLDFGLLPSSRSLTKTFDELPLDLKVLTRQGEVYRSTRASAPLSPLLAQTVACLKRDASAVPIGPGDDPRLTPFVCERTLAIPANPDHIGHIWPLSGGYALLAQDVRELNAVHAELEAAHACLLRENEMLEREREVAVALADLEAEARLMTDVEAALASSLARVSQIIDGLPPATTPSNRGRRERALKRARMLLAYCKRKGSLVLSEDADPEFDLERIRLIVNELSSDLRAVGIDAAATVNLRHAPLAQEVSILYDCIYDFAQVAFETTAPALIYHLGERDDATVELRAQLQSADEDDLSRRPQSVALRSLLDSRDVVYRLSGDEGALRLIVRMRGGSVHEPGHE